MSIDKFFSKRSFDRLKKRSRTVDDLNRRTRIEDFRAPRQFLFSAQNSLDHAGQTNTF